MTTNGPKLVKVTIQDVCKVCRTVNARDATVPMGTRPEKNENYYCKGPRCQSARNATVEARCERIQVILDMEGRNPGIAERTFVKKGNRIPEGLLDDIVFLRSTGENIVARLPQFLHDAANAHDARKRMALSAIKKRREKPLDDLVVDDAVEVAPDVPTELLAPPPKSKRTRATT